ncbi:T3SS effector HopA1 family protein [Streptomyces sp. NPDC090085]|uniref:T3SS effector HopA1 family protein n=1 Tax=Streptomyces sp. NPDC090085 TaxID=3365943 RepID=UPI003810EDB0
MHHTARQLLEENGLGATSRAQQERTVDRVYRAVHAAPLRPETGFSSDRKAYRVMVAEAERCLGDLTHERTGFTLIAPDGTGRTLAACPDGVEVVLEEGEFRTSATGLTSVRTSGLSTHVGARWLYWTPLRFPGGTDARVYVHARSEQALDVWCRIVRALHRGGLVFAAKVGGSAAMLDRTDCIVLYCSADDLPAVIEAAAAHCPDPVPAVSGFSVAVRPGIGAALVPEHDTGPIAMSVGYYWSRALVDAWDTAGPDGLEPVYARLARSWEETRQCLRTEDAA